MCQVQSFVGHRTAKLNAIRLINTALGRRKISHHHEQAARDQQGVHDGARPQIGQNPTLNALKKRKKKK